jgi:hypothetical protein
MLRKKIKRCYNQSRLGGGKERYYMDKEQIRRLYGEKDSYE